MVFAFTCQSNVIPILAEIRRPSVKKGTQFVLSGLLLVLIMYLLCEIFGFLTFYKEYDGSLTDFPVQILTADYGSNDTLIIIVPFT